MITYSSLNIQFPEREIFLRLGGHLTKTVLSAEELIRFRSLGCKAFEVCRPQGRWDICKVNSVTENCITLDDGFQIRSRDFASRCCGINYLWFGAVTLGNAVTNLRDNSEKVSESAVFDAVGAECADAAMDALHSLARQALQRQGLTLAPRRFSPGYGDMDLEIQQFFFERLDLSELDIVL